MQKEGSQLVYKEIRWKIALKATKRFKRLQRNKLLLFIFYFDLMYLKRLLVWNTSYLVLNTNKVIRKILIKVSVSYNISLLE